MKIRVIKDYVDQYTKIYVFKGRVMTVTDERGLELIGKGVAEEVKEPSK